MSDHRVSFAEVVRAFGVPATVEPLDAGAVTTDGVWDASPPEEERPFGTDLPRREPRRVFALPRNVLPALKRGSIILAPEATGEPVLRWKVDGLVRVEWDCWRVFVVPAPN